LLDLIVSVRINPRKTERGLLDPSGCKLFMLFSQIVGEMLREGHGTVTIWTLLYHYWHYQ